jgi:hypothetical protein
VAAAVTGGPSAGAYDAAPSTSTGIETDPEVLWDAYTDLDIYFEAIVDANHDGFPNTEISPVAATTWGSTKALFRP